MAKHPDDPRRPGKGQPPTPKPAPKKPELPEEEDVLEVAEEILDVDEALEIVEEDVPLAKPVAPEAKAAPKSAPPKASPTPKPGAPAASAAKPAAPKSPPPAVPNLSLDEPEEVLEAAELVEEVPLAMPTESVVEDVLEVAEPIEELPVAEDVLDVAEPIEELPVAEDVLDVAEVVEELPEDVLDVAEAVEELPVAEEAPAKPIAAAAHTEDILDVAEPVEDAAEAVIAEQIPEAEEASGVAQPVSDIFAQEIPEAEEASGVAQPVSDIFAQGIPEAKEPSGVAQPVSDIFAEEIPEAKEPSATAQSVSDIFAEEVPEATEPSGVAQLVSDLATDAPPIAQPAGEAPPSSDIFAKEFLEDSAPVAKPPSGVVVDEAVAEVEEVPEAEEAPSGLIVDETAPVAEAQPSSGIIAEEVPEAIESPSGLIVDEAEPVAEAQPSSGIIAEEVPEAIESPSGLIVDEAEPVAEAQPSSGIIAEEVPEAIESPSGLIVDEAEPAAEAQPSSGIIAEEVPEAIESPSGLIVDEAEPVAEAQPSSGIIAEEVPEAIESPSGLIVDEAEPVAEAEPSSGIIAEEVPEALESPSGLIVEGVEEEAADALTPDQVVEEEAAEALGDSVFDEAGSDATLPAAGSGTNLITEDEVQATEQESEEEATFVSDDLFGASKKATAADTEQIVPLAEDEAPAESEAAMFTAPDAVEELEAAEEVLEGTDEVDVAEELLGETPSAERPSGVDAIAEALESGVEKPPSSVARKKMEAVEFFQDDDSSALKIGATPKPGKAKPPEPRKAGKQPGKVAAEDSALKIGTTPPPGKTKPGKKKPAGQLAADDSAVVIGATPPPGKAKSAAKKLPAKVEEEAIEEVAEVDELVEEITDEVAEVAEEPVEEVGEEVAEIEEVAEVSEEVEEVAEEEAVEEVAAEDDVDDEAAALLAADEGTELDMGEAGEEVVEEAAEEDDGAATEVVVDEETGEVVDEEAGEVVDEESVVDEEAIVDEEAGEIVDEEAGEVVDEDAIVDEEVGEVVDEDALVDEEAIVDDEIVGEEALEEDEKPAKGKSGKKAKSLDDEAAELFATEDESGEAAAAAEDSNIFSDSAADVFADSENAPKSPVPRAKGPTKTGKGTKAQKAPDFEDMAVEELEDEPVVPAKKQGKTKAKGRVVDEELEPLDEFDDGPRGRGYGPAPKPRYGRRWMGGVLVGWLLLAGGAGAVWYFAPDQLYDGMNMIPKSPNAQDDFVIAPKKSLKGEKTTLQKAREHMNKQEFAQALDMLKTATTDDEKATRGEARWFLYSNNNRFPKADDPEVVAAKKDLPKEHPLTKQIDAAIAGSATAEQIADAKDRQEKAEKAQKLAEKRKKEADEQVAKLEKEAEENLQKFKDLDKNLKEIDKILKDKVEVTGKAGLDKLLDNLQKVEDTVKDIDGKLEKAKIKDSGVKGVEALIAARDDVDKKRKDLDTAVKEALKVIEETNAAKSSGNPLKDIVEGVIALRNKAESPLVVPITQATTTISGLGTGAVEFLQKGFDQAAVIAELKYFQLRDTFVEGPEKKVDTWLTLFLDRKNKDPKDVERALKETDWVRSKGSKADDEARAKALFVMGLVQRNQEKFDEAKKSLKEAAKEASALKTATPWPEVLKTALAELTDPKVYFLPRADKLFEAGRFADAIDVLDLALKAIPNHPQLLSQRGVARLEMARPLAKIPPAMQNQIRADASAALMDDVLAPRAAFTLGQLEELLGNRTLAEKFYRSAREKADPSERGTYTAALAQLLLSEPRPVVEDDGKKVDPKDDKKVDPKDDKKVDPKDDKKVDPKDDKKVDPKDDKKVDPKDDKKVDPKDDKKVDPKDDKKVDPKDDKKVDPKDDKKVDPKDDKKVDPKDDKKVDPKDDKKVDPKDDKKVDPKDDKKVDPKDDKKVDPKDDKKVDPKDDKKVDPKDDKGDEARLDASDPVAAILIMVLTGVQPDALFDEEDPEVTKRLKETLELAEELLKSKNKDGSPNLKDRAQGHMIRGQVWAKQGKRTEGLKEYVKGLEIFTPKAMAKELIEMVETHPAFKFGTQSLRPNPFLSEQHFGKGLNLYFARDYVEAEKQFETAISYFKQDARYWYFLGLSRVVQKGKRDEATYAFEEGSRHEAANNPPPSDVNVALERVQGILRVRVNEYRQRTVAPGN